MKKATENFFQALERIVRASREAALAAERTPEWESRMLAKRKAERMRILPGYPRKTPFAGLDEARAYLAAPKLVCLVCGKSYRMLPGHLRDTHGIDPDRYRQAYGLPWTVGLAGAKTRQKKSNALSTRLAQPEFAAKWFAESDRHRGAAHEAAKAQRKTPFKREVSHGNLAKAGIVVGRWQEADFLRILKIMKAEDLLMRDVAGKFPGLPPYWSACKWFYSSPERYRLLVSTVYQLSNAAQVRAGMIGPALVAEMQRMKRGKASVREIVAATGISEMTVRKHLRSSNTRAGAFHGVNKP